MRVTIETSNMKEFQALIQVLSSLKLESIVVGNSENGISAGDKSINPEDLFGIWKSAPRNITDLRSRAWKRDWD